MTYAQIKQLALKQMDEDPHDMDEHGDLLGAYINEGYQIAVDDYLRPKEMFRVRTDENGDADISGLGIRRITAVQDAEHRYSVWGTQDALGHTLHTARKLAALDIVAIVGYPEMTEDGETPRIPSWAHGALADYACWRYLSNGNLAKQSKANFYYGRFAQQMQRIDPQGMGSVTGYKNLYTVTDARWTR